jgi:hypothetical protein
VTTACESHLRGYIEPKAVNRSLLELGSLFSKFHDPKTVVQKEQVPSINTV